MSTKDPSTREVPWDSSPREIVRKLQFLIATNHVTVQRLAEGTGMPQRQLQQILDGVSLPTEAMLAKCAEYFGVTLDFVLGKEDGAGKKSSAGRAGAKSGPRNSRPGSPTSVPKGRNSKGKPGGLNVRTLATRHQALIELLIEKGVITARDYHEKVQQVEGRSG